MDSIKTPLLAVTVFKNVIKNEVVSYFIDFISSMEQDSEFDIVLSNYSRFVSGLYDTNDINLFEYVKNLIYSDKNILSNDIKNERILETTEYEISLINNLLFYNYENVKKELLSKFPACDDIINHLPYFSMEGLVAFKSDDILKSYKTNGYGIYSCYSAFKFCDNKQVQPVKHFNALTFSDLKNYDYQKEVVKKNTKAFIEGKQANNILLYGDRGCGKSSTVKALVNEFKENNIKIIQVYKESFIYLADLFEQIRDLPLKFIIFADDISFSEDDKNFSSIKAVLEGSLSEKPDNAIIYATTNRMHLVKESFSSREGNEVHCNDTIDETVSLSDRFGIMLTFSLLTKTEYLDIAEKIAKDYNITVNDDFYKKAEEFAALKAIRTPRVARQFIIDYMTN